MSHLVGQGPTAAAGPTSEVWTTPFPHQLGSRMKDKDGNEYVFVDFTGTVYGATVVAITPGDWTAAAIGTTHRGPIGIACGAATSDNAGWVQIYGRATMQLGMSGVSPSDAANGPTTLSTSAGTLFKLSTSATSPNGLAWVSEASLYDGYVVQGLFIAADVSVGDVSAVTSATSHNGRQTTVFMNYPWVQYEERTT